MPHKKLTQEVPHEGHTNFNHNATAKHAHIMDGVDNVCSHILDGADTITITIVDKTVTINSDKIAI